MNLPVFLFVCVAGAAPGTPNFLCRQHQMPSMAMCEQAAKTFNATPVNATREKDSRVFIYCATEGEWHTNKK
jgi:hypothetical protein